MYRLPLVKYEQIFIDKIELCGKGYKSVHGVNKNRGNKILNPDNLYAKNTCKAF